MAKRVFLIVLDSLGIGEAPDASDYGDVGANTLKRISKSDKFSINNLIAMGLGNIDGVDCIDKTASPTASVARLRELSRGKDTTIGHWELMGIVSENPLPTYPDGFPSSLVKEIENAIGREFLCNKVYSGTEVIKDYGREHILTEKPILYTSADSVFQIAADEGTIPTKELYRCCEIARKILTGEHGVGRVIARPFIEENGEFKRTANRRDFSLEPPKETLLDAIKSSGSSVIAIGKISDIFAGRGISESIKTHGNTEGIEKTVELMKKDFSGLCFTNLVDFDMLYGHRQDTDGYANALSEFDRALPDMLSLLGEDDLLIITADHGCDPGDDSTDHTREYVPCIIYKKGAPIRNLGTIDGFFYVAEAIAEALGVSYEVKL